MSWMPTHTPRTLTARSHTTFLVLALMAVVASGCGKSDTAEAGANKRSFLALTERL